MTEEQLEEMAEIYDIEYLLEVCDVSNYTLIKILYEDGYLDKFIEEYHR